MALCGDCKADKPGDTFMTEVNPEGGYSGRQVLVCDDCMRSGRWEEWKAEHWPNWPEKPRKWPVETSQG